MFCRVYVLLLLLPVENRDFFEPWGSVLFVELVSYFTEQYRANPTGADADRSLQLLLDAYKCCRLASKTEYNKGEWSPCELILHSLLTIYILLFSCYNRIF